MEIPLAICMTCSVMYSLIALFSPRTSNCNSEDGMTFRPSPAFSTPTLILVMPSPWRAIP